jgi:predicted ATP-grasp superfamily ATP-dependent carboligase
MPDIAPVSEYIPQGCLQGCLNIVVGQGDPLVLLGRSRCKLDGFFKVIYCSYA